MEAARFLRALILAGPYRIHGADRPWHPVHQPDR